MVLLLALAPGIAGLQDTGTLPVPVMFGGPDIGLGHLILELTGSVRVITDTDIIGVIGTDSGKQTVPGTQVFASNRCPAQE